MTIHCPQCGADISIQPRSIQLMCPFCETSLVLKKDHLFESYKVDPTCEEEPAISVTKHLLFEKNRELKVVKTELLFLPFYRFIYDKKGKSHESVFSALRKPPVFLTSIPSGRIMPIEEKDPLSTIKPEKELSEITESMKEDKVQSLSEILLLYVPFWKITVSSGEEVWIDAVQGKIIADTVIEKQKSSLKFINAALSGLLVVLLIEGITIPVSFVRLGIQVLTAGAFLYIIKRKFTNDD